MNCRKCGTKLTEKHRKELKADMVFTSPPYNAGYIDCNRGIKGKKYINDNDLKANYQEFLELFLTPWLDVAKFVWVNLQYLSGNTSDLVGFLYKNRDYLREVAVWQKTNPAPSINNNVMNAAVEHVFCFSREVGGRISGEFEKGAMQNHFSSSVNQENIKGVHHACFPVKLPEYFIKVTKGLVSDPFLGSGSTLIACEKTKRKCYGMEIDPYYCDVIVKRWEDYTGKQAILSQDS